MDDDKVKILCVDDEKKNLELLEAFLEPKGYAVLFAENGKVGIEMVKRDRPNLILLDVMMPEMDGLQACRELRKDSGNRVIPIMMVTSSDKDKDIVQSLEIGADDYIIKPVSKKELLDKVVNLLSKAKTAELPSQRHFKKLRPEKR
jgi:two-component system alkaline phosphatase synthesis response regulator PhoP